MVSNTTISKEKGGIPDSNAKKQSLNELGWVDIKKNDPKIIRLKNHLRENNGIKGLEILNPDQIEDAVRLFYRDGFVVVRDALNAEQLKIMRGGCDRVIHEMMALDKHRVGNRGSHRYSFGGASVTGHQVHNPEWAMLIDLPTVSPILTAIFGSRDYICRGGGGDFCLPGAVEYQPLHSDMGDRREIGNASFGSFKDPRGLLTFRDLPCPYVCCNFTMVDFTTQNGPIREIPGTQNSHEPMPRRREEPEWMKLSTLCPAPAGAVIFRDVRTWHGGTPNLSDQVRAMPNAEFYAPWFREPMNTCMPRDIYESLSDHGKTICRYIVAEKEQNFVTGYKENLGSTPSLMSNMKNKLS